MRERRVGTLTLGILLITLGILYLLSNVFSLPIDVAFIKFWPLVLISLGIEVLYYDYACTKQNSVIKFSGISFFLIVIALFLSFGAYVFGKISIEFLDPSSPIFYRNYIHNISYLENIKNLV